MVRTVGGGIDSLKQVLFKLKKFKFSGYIKTNIQRETTASEGYLIVKGGAPVAAIYGRRGDGRFIITKEGEDALKLIWGDTYDRECSVQIHGRVDVEAIINEHPEAMINLVQKVAEEKRRKSKYSLSWGKGEKADAQSGAETDIGDERRTEFEQRLDYWRSSGYVVKSLENSLDDLDGAQTAFDEFENNVRQIEILKSELENVASSGHEKEVERIKAMFKNPGKIEAIQTAINELRSEVEREAAAASMPVEPEVTAEEEDDEDPLAGLGKILPPERDKDDRCNVCGSNMFGRNECPTCGAKKEEAVTRMPEKELGKSLASKEANLIPEFTFETFVVGEGNRFSHAATLAVSKVESSAYNPLFITSGSGMGKTHLLNAIGNYVTANFKEKRVLYVTMERFISEFFDASKANKMTAFRDRYRNVDFLLLDDVHFIADRQDVQDELFHTFNALYEDGRQIVMTSSRPLRDLRGLSERLVSKFESGLVTDIKPPNFELRIAILRKKLEKTGLTVGDDVLSFMAKRYTRNIRKLEGALGTLIAYCELMKRPPTIEAAVDALKEESPDSPDDIELVPAVPTKKKLESLKESHSYIIEEDRPVKCFELFSDNLKQGFKGMALTRVNPKRVIELFDLGDTTVLWLTDREGDPDVKIPPVLEKIIYRIEDLLNSPGKSILLIDGLDYLISNNSFDAVLRFLRRLIDEISETEAIFIMSLTPETINEQGLKILEREMEIISFM